MTKTDPAAWLDVAKTPTAAKRANLYLFHGVEGSGKTGLAARFPDPLVLMTPRERGLLTLVANGQAPNVSSATFPGDEAGVPDWPAALRMLEDVRSGSHSFRTLVVDVANHLEEACHAYVIANRWGGDREKFYAYAAEHGAESALDEWRRLLFLLDAIRTERGMAVVLCCHTNNRGKFLDPQAGEYNRFVPLLHPKTWGPTFQAMDVVGFINFETTAADAGKGKKIGLGGETRRLYLQRSAFQDAKNRIGLPPSIDLGGSADDAWTNFSKAVKAATGSKKRATKAAGESTGEKTEGAE